MASGARDRISVTFLFLRGEWNAHAREPDSVNYGGFPVKATGELRGAPEPLRRRLAARVAGRWRKKPGQAPTPGGRWWRVAAVCLGVTIAAVAIPPAESRPSEYDVKAAYLVNFGRFLREEAKVAGPASDFAICVLGEDPMGHALDTIAEGQKIDERPVRVRRVEEAAEARGCDEVYISASETSRMGADAEALRGSGALTVSDAPEFLRAGGMIQFVIQRNHVRFRVNLDAARKARVVLSSELLRVALSVDGARATEVTP